MNRSAFGLIAAPLVAAVFLAVNARAAQNDFDFDSGAIFNTFQDSGRGLAVPMRETDPSALEIDLDSVEIKELGSGFELLGQKPGGGQIDFPIIGPKPGGKIPSPAPKAITPERVINIGKSVWDFIKESKPIIDTTNLYANAVPHGITDWTQLGGWGAPKTTLYSFSAKNKSGKKVVDVTYIILRTGRGNYKGTGQYLTGVSAIPIKIEVGWGYKFTMGLEVPSVSNVGTAEHPIAGMTLHANWTIENNFKATRGAGIYYLRGDGLFQQIAAPEGVKRVD
ncbi:hypothetical protein ACFL2T_08100 [Elusimicrobiota bacterium]